MNFLTVLFIVVIIILAHDNHKLRKENNELKAEYLKSRFEKKYTGDTEPQQPQTYSRSTASKPAQNSYDMSFMYGGGNADPPAQISEAYTAKSFPVTADSSAASSQEDKAYAVQEIRTSGNITPDISVSETSYKRTKKKMNTANAKLILGTMFITLAGIIFASAAWFSVGNITRALLLFSFSGIFFVINAFTEKKPSLQSTSRIFFLLGAIFLPVAASACGIFSLFGDDFSFRGSLKYLFYSLTALTAALPAFVGMRKYRIKTVCVISLLCFSASAIFFLRQAVPNNEIFALTISLTSAVLVFIRPKIPEKADEFLLGCSDLFIIINMFGSALIAMKFADSGLTAFMTCSAAAAAFLGSDVSKKNEYLSVIPFTVLMCTASFKLFKPYDSLYLEFFVLISVITAVLSSIEIFGKKTRDFLSAVCTVSAVPAVICNLFAESYTDAYIGENLKIVYLLCMILMTAEVIVLHLRGHKNMIWLIAPFAAASAHRFGEIVLGRYACIAAGLVIIALYLAFVYFEKIRSDFSDAVFCIVLFIDGMVLLFHDESIAAEIFSMIFILTASVLSLISSYKYPKLTIFQFTFVPVVISAALPSMYIFPGYGYLTADILFVILSVGFCVFAFRPEAQGARLMTLLGIIPTTFVCTIVFNANSENPFVFLLASAVCGFVYNHKLELGSSFLFYLSAFSAYMGTGYTAVLISGNNEMFGLAGISFVIMYIVFMFIGKMRSNHSDAIFSAGLFINGIILSIADINIISNVSALIFILTSSVMTVKSSRDFDSLKKMRNLLVPALMCLAFPLDNIFGIGFTAADMIFLICAAVFSVILLRDKKEDALSDYTVPLIVGIMLCAAACPIIYISFDRYPFIYLLAAAVCGFLYLGKTESNSASLVYISSSFFYLGSAALCAYIMRSAETAVCVAYTSIFLAVISVVILLLFIHRKSQMKYSEHFIRMSVILGAISPALCFYSSWPDVGKFSAASYFTGVVALTAIYILTGLSEPKITNFVLFVPALMMIPSAYSLIDSKIMTYEECLVLMNAEFLLTCFGGRFIYKNGLRERKSFDVLSLASAAALPAMYSCISSSSVMTDLVMWYLWFAFAAYVFSFNGRIAEKSACVTNTAGALLLCGAYYCQPFGDIPDHFMLEFNTFGFILFMLGIAVIWRKHHGKGTFYFVSAVIYMIIAEISCIVSGFVSDSVFIGILLVIMFAFALRSKQKRWLVLSVCGTVSLTLIMTAQFMLNISWWIYLLLAGIGFIIWGIVSEAKKK